MNFQHVLVIGRSASAADGDAGTLVDAVRASRLDEAVMEATQAVAFLQRAVGDGVEPAAVIIAPDVEHAVLVARNVRRVWPQGQLILVQHRGGAGQRRLDTGPTPLLGAHWSVADFDARLLPRIITDAVKATRRRVQFRSFIDGANRQLASPKALLDIEYRRRMVSDHFLGMFLAQTPDAILGLDAALHVLYCSVGAQALFGIDAQAVFDTPAQALPFWSAALDAPVARLRAGESTVTVEIDIERAHRRVSLEISYSAVMEGNTLIGVSLICRDVSARLQAQQRIAEHQAELEAIVAQRTYELGESQRSLFAAQKLEAIGKLTGGVAHDFNNVLQIIAGNLQLLRAGGRNDALTQRRLDASVSAVERAAKLSSQLLAFGRRQPLQPVPTNLGRLLRDIDDLLRRALGEAIEVETIVAAGLWNTLVDVNQLENVVLNLAINARDAMNGQGKLTLELGNATLDEDYVRRDADVIAGQYVMLAVSDIGKGMTQDVIEQAFEPFFTTKPEGEGTGLGLSTAYGFVKQTRGHIKIYSEVGHGTTVRLYLPRTHAPETLPPVEITGPVVGGSEIILVVEDDAALRATVVDSLTGLGYKVLKAADGQAALSIVQSGVPIDLLFTDVVMPGAVRSPDLARQAKQLIPDIAVLFTSGYTQNAIVHGGRLDADVELLSKPYRHETLARKIRHMLANRQVPPRQPALPEGALSARAAQAPNLLRIMVVEDDTDLREIACEYFGLLGHAAVGHADAESALAALRTSDVDVLFSDLTLPGLSGVELAKLAVRMHPAITVIFASGYGDVDARDSGFKALSLPKPYDLHKLKSILEQI